eukprot:CAMPEP_0196210100 /NCGR_PEP_ID=MMETSP0912-20130531/11339_1 /TAXON_ID=49265 /ORGANISM="Thalassiosira rotula, Strain GSO102" /LENGTH=66 /DNA_ID=CAMNT_0041485163 /DNA_START=60 /DNA_END=257 /DNA_ORIENTATION=-
MASCVAARLDWGATKALAPVKAAIARAAENFMVDDIIILFDFLVAIHYGGMDRQQVVVVFEIEQVL